MLQTEIPGATPQEMPLRELLDYFYDTKTIYINSVRDNVSRNEKIFNPLGNLLIGWAKTYLGIGFEKTLINGYFSFVKDVSKSQILYERKGSYANKSYDEVYKSVYASKEHMDFYHWGVFLTTLFWEHHLKLYKFYVDHFLAILEDQPNSNLVELGCGSGIWGFLFLNEKKLWNVTGVDISETSIQNAVAMSKAIKFSDRGQYLVADATQFKTGSTFDAGMSCLLLEHLENPQQLLNNLAANLKPHGYAFITAALTAAEVDHIFEFKNESELILLAERAGFRVISSFSSAPAGFSQEAHFLPRSMALVLQKRKNEIW